MITDTAERFSLRFDADNYRRIIAGKEVILHCHHYNSRIQRTIEFAEAVDGRSMVIECAEAVFREHLELAFIPEDDESTRWQVATDLYSHLGYGSLDFARVQDDLVTASSSHFVEGWRAGFPDCDRPVCSVTSGYIQATFLAVTGELVTVQEECCALQQGSECRFRVDRNRATPSISLERVDTTNTELSSTEMKAVDSNNVNAQEIIEALVAMPIHGGEDGLIPSFNVYLASTPADLYNLMCIRFIEEMTAKGLGELAREQLVYDAETCGMNTFRGIMASTEWDALVAPMIQEDRDTLFAIIAVSNALGWGNWHVSSYDNEDGLALFSPNAYEASGVLTWRGRVAEPCCLMLTGVGAGLMQLIHGAGTLEERFGQYQSSELQCRGQGDACCTFEVECSD